MELINLEMSLFIKVIIKRDKNMEKEFILGLMEKSLVEIDSIINCMEMCHEVNGEQFYVTFRFGKLISERRVKTNQDVALKENNIPVEGRVKFSKEDILNENVIDNINGYISKKCGFLVATS